MLTNTEEGANKFGIICVCVCPFVNPCMIRKKHNKAGLIQWFHLAEKQELPPEAPGAKDLSLG